MIGESVSLPLVSVVIPAYNQAAFLGDAIRSVLGQSYARLELVVVNDASPDETSRVVRAFPDARVRLIEHDRNRGLPAARNTGILASSGDLVALLDADDYFHPDKLRWHVDLLDGRRDVDVTYNARFNLHHSSTAIRDLWRPPREVGLADFVLGWPFAPSDMVVRREPLLRAGLFDDRLFSGGEDVDLPCRLALAGSRCVGVDRALNYRRYHAGRRKRNLDARWQDYQDALDRAFADPRCPPDVARRRDDAYASHCLELVSLAYLQGERDLGERFLREAVRLDPGLLAGDPCRLMRHLAQVSSADATRSHEETLQAIVSEMPPDMGLLAGQCAWAVRHGWLLKATRAAIWSEPATEPCPLPALRPGDGDDSYVTWAAGQLDGYELEHGAGSASTRARDLVRMIRAAGARPAAARLEGLYLINTAFRLYREGRSGQVPASVLRACIADPIHLTNRGVLSILLRSAVSPNRAPRRTS